MARNLFRAISLLYALAPYLAAGLQQAPQVPLINAQHYTGHSQEQENPHSLFSLRHLVHHGTHKYPDLHKQFDISDSASTLWIEDENGSLKEVTRPLMAQGRETEISRLKERKISSINSMIDAGYQTGDFWTSGAAPEWTTDSITGPNVTDKETILTLAHMMANAYEPTPHQGAWHDVNGTFNSTLGFGWEEDGIRGYIYANGDGDGYGHASLVVISIKGGSLAIWDGGGTVKNDKENVNLLFACCCGQGSYFYRQVCDCSRAANTCNVDCVTACLRGKDRYYAAARELFANVAALYPNAQIWLAGHSLGGAMSALLGQTYGVPAVTFETPPDALAARRLGLPVPPGKQARAHSAVYQFGVSSDPIYTGTCHGPAASCSYVGYAFESSCHAGSKCVYDVVSDWGWRSSISTHGIAGIIKKVIMKYDTVPECRVEPGCNDCVAWKETRGPYTTTVVSSAESTKSRTRTATCRTPGWWGCMDKTSSVAVSSSTGATTSTRTCETPGWFGCHDKTTVTGTTGTTGATATGTSSTGSMPTTAMTTTSAA